MRDIQWAALAAVWLLGCSTGPEPEVVTFTVNGRTYSNLGYGYATPYAFVLSAEDYSSFGKIDLVVNECFGNCDRTIVPQDSGVLATLRDLRGVLYSTVDYGGGGQVRVLVTECRSTTQIDPETGEVIPGVIYCTASGTFGFTARSEAGDSVVVRGGRFHLSVRHY